MINEIIPIWKPIDWTSFDVVKKIRNQIKPSKVGHAGTLDPFAEGVLMLCAGSYTKKVESFMDKEKEYEATIQLGIETDTLDITGKIIKKELIPNLTINKINKVLKKYVGTIKQEPPMFSALKVNGVRLYKIARKGITLNRKLRDVNIYKIHLVTFNEDSIKINVVCGRGTYIRSLGQDIANDLGTSGHLIALKRTRIGEFNKEKCIEINNFPKWLSLRNS